MPMSSNGLVKLVEECGELTQAAAKKIAYPVGPHPDGDEPLNHRIEDEIADVLAAARFVVGKLRLDKVRIAARTRYKLALFEKWDKNED